MVSKFFKFIFKKYHIKQENIAQKVTFKDNYWSKIVKNLQKYIMNNRRGRRMLALLI